MKDKEKVYGDRIEGNPSLCIYVLNRSYTSISDRS